MVRLQLSKSAPSCEAPHPFRCSLWPPLDALKLYFRVPLQDWPALSRVLQCIVMAYLQVTLKELYSSHLFYCTDEGVWKHLQCILNSVLFLQSIACRIFVQIKGKVYHHQTYNKFFNAAVLVKNACLINPLLHIGHYSVRMAKISILK